MLTVYCKCNIIFLQQKITFQNCHARHYILHQFHGVNIINLTYWLQTFLVYWFWFQCKIYWQQKGDYLGVKVDRYTKSKKVGDWNNLIMLRTNDDVNSYPFTCCACNLNGTGYHTCIHVWIHMYSRVGNRKICMQYRSSRYKV